MGKDSRSESPSKLASLAELVSRAFSSEHLLSRTVPMTGCLSYTAFALHMYHPRGLARLFPGTHLPIANCLLLNAHIGSGLYLYWSRHLRTLSPVRRVAFSAYGAVLLNFGSILLWALTKNQLPQDTPGVLRSIMALATSFGLLALGREYITYVDSLESKLECPTSESVRDKE